ncbi:radical SAM protein [Candidatus Thorarchaeota archaeon]|nr:MAG: radical SAM protein [Candidatus Thorarchaeota archaeon]
MERYSLEVFEPKSLPYQTKSLCPDCLLQDKEVRVIDATVYEEDGKVMMSKTCPDHGDFKEIYWSDAEMFRRSMRYWFKSVGIDNPRTECEDGCPLDCGLCENHLAHTALGLIDVTNRCNLRCPICFANAAASGRVYEPSPEQVLEMMKNLRRNLPVPCPAVQFAGGEPTVSDNLVQYVKWAKQLGFDHIMIATNGIRMAKSVDYLQQLKDAGLNTIYLQFDGVTERPYLEARNQDLRPIKDKVLDHCRSIGLDGVVLVPTIVGGLNDEELGDIVRYSIENRDIVRCINFQPVSITGRIDYEERQKMRITLPDAIKRIEEQTDGLVKADHWYPVASMLGVGRALGLMKGVPTVELHSHFACGMATFLFVEDDGTVYPITDVVDIEALINTLGEVCDLYAGRSMLAGTRAKLKLLGFLRHIKKKNFMRPIITSFLKKGSYSSLAAFMHRVIMLGMMHFQDPFNIDLERVQHCTINYATPDGRIIPFCNYNTVHRDLVEAKFAEKI